MKLKVNLCSTEESIGKTATEKVISHCVYLFHGLIESYTHHRLFSYELSERRSFIRAHTTYIV